jgi:hypothetical protein
MGLGGGLLSAALILPVLLDARGETVRVNVTDLRRLEATGRSQAAFEGVACISLSKGLVAQHTVIRQDYTFEKVAMSASLAPYAGCTAVRCRKCG